MRRYQEAILKAGTGLGIQGASVAVRIANQANPGTGALATLYAANDVTGATLSNPLLTDDQGEFYFYAADGFYDLVINHSSTIEIYPDVPVGGLVQGPPGVNGGQGTSAGLAALFAAASGMVVAAGVTTVQTAGYSVAGVGGANYIYDSTITAINVGVGGNIGTAFLAADGRGFRLDDKQWLSIDMFGAQSTNWPTVGADTLPAWNSFQAWVRSRPRNDFGILEGGPELHFPGACYYFTDTIQLKTTVRLRGMGSGYSGGSSTMLRFAAGKAGIVVNRFDTLGDVAESPTTTGGDGSIIEGFYLFSGGGTPDLLKSGVRMRSRAVVRDCLIGVFPGAGVCIVAAVGSPVDNPYAGNCNNWRLDNVRAQSNGFGGFYVSGGDANAGLATMCDASKNRLFGFWDTAFLGNTWIGCHADINGAFGNYSGAVTNDTNVVSHAGNRYYLNQGQEALGVGTTPGTNADVWVLMGAGGATAEIPAWGTAGHTYTSGGAYFHTGSANKSLFDGCYYEGGQAPPQIEGAAIVINGFMGDGLSTGAPFLQGSLGQGLKQQRHYTQAITYGDGTTGSVSLGGPVVGNTQPILQWASALSTPTNANNPSFLFHDGPTGDVYWQSTLVRKPFRFTGPSTARTYGGRPTTECRFTTEIDQLALGTGLDAGNNSKIIRYGAAAPTTGTWGRGDIVFNSAPNSVGAVSNTGWKCTTAGTPGTWAQFGGVAAARADVAAAPTQAEFNDLLAKLRAAGLLAV